MCNPSETTFSAEINLTNWKDLAGEGGGLRRLREKQYFAKAFKPENMKTVK